MISLSTLVSRLIKITFESVATANKLSTGDTLTSLIISLKFHSLTELFKSEYFQSLTFPSFPPVKKNYPFLLMSKA